MKSSIITIGNELLGGYTVDSNGAWIGRKLIDIGIAPCWKSTVADNKEEIINACLLYTSPSPRDVEESRMPSSA